jgi:hypothetical protein
MENSNPILRYFREKRQTTPVAGILPKRVKRDNGGLDESAGRSNVSNGLSLSTFLGCLTANNLKPTILHDIIPLGTNTAFARKSGIKAGESKDERAVCDEQAEYWMRTFKEKLKEAKGKGTLYLKI